MVVLAPARDIGPYDRGILAAAELKRPDETRIWHRTSIGEMRARAMHHPRRMHCTRGKRGKRSQRQYDSDPTKRGGASLQATRVSERFRCQPVSSSDRV